jgi:membrane protein DedA with SNARE-associated domain
LLLSLVEVTRELGTWAYVVLFILAIVEGPVATLVAGIAAASGLMKPEWVFLSAASGNLFADGLWYILGYFGKLEWLERYAGWMGVRQRHVLRFRSDIACNAARLIFFAKMTLGFVIPVLVATGLARVPVRRWVLPWVSAEFIWTGLLVFLGYYFGSYLQVLERGVEIVAVVGAVAFTALMVYYLSQFHKRTLDGEGI